MTDLRHSPLDAEHRALGARMVDVRRLGDADPVRAACSRSTARAASTRSCSTSRTSARCGSRGPGAFADAAVGVHQRPRPHRPGRAQYTHLLDPDDAHVVDDIIVWWVADDEFLVMPNASNTDPLVGALEDAVAAMPTGECTVDDVTATRAVLAVQGPEARARARAPSCPARGRRCRASRVRAGRVRRRGRAGSRGTGLHGRGRRRAPRARGRAPPACGDGCSAPGIAPAGLGARDTLRLEAGLPLHGHELGPGITPLQAGLGWVVRFDKGDFRGRDAAAWPSGPRRAPAAPGLLVEGRQIPRAECRGPRTATGSSARSPAATSRPCSSGGSRSRSSSPTVADGAAVEIDIRGRPSPRGREAAVRAEVAAAAGSSASEAVDLERERPRTDVLRDGGGRGAEGATSPETLRPHGPLGRGNSGEQSVPRQRGKRTQPSRRQEEPGWLEHPTRFADRHRRHPIAADTRRGCCTTLGMASRSTS